MGAIASRIVWLAGCTALAVLGAGVQLDRATLRNPAIAALVPSPFRSFALSSLSAAAVRRGDAATATVLARTLVARHPVPAESLSRLGVAETANGNQAVALEAFMRASERGWRDAIVQRLVAIAAIDEENWGVAADRLAALWQTEQASSDVLDMTAALIAAPEGRKAFLDRIGSFPNIREAFVKWAAGQLQPDAIAGSLKTLKAAGHAADCGSLAGEARKALELGDGARAIALWYTTCASRPDGEFTFDFTTQDDVAGGPFDWSYPGAAGLERTFTRQGDGTYAIAFKNGDSSRKPLAVMMSILSPGVHSVRLRSRGGVAQLQLAVTCLSTRASRDAQRFQVSLNDTAVPIVIPVSGCQTQRLVLLASPGRGALVGLSFD